MYGLTYAPWKILGQNPNFYLVFDVFFRHREPFLLHIELFFRFVNTNNYLENLLYKNNTYAIEIPDHLKYKVSNL